MADIKIWVGTDSGNEGKFNVAANWSLNRVPTGTDVAYFDATAVANCTFSGALSCAGINVTAAYSGIVDFNDQAITTSGNQTYDGTGEVKCGTGTIKFGGNLDNKDQAGWTRETSTFRCTANADIVTDTGSRLTSLTVDSGVTLTIGAASSTLLISSGTITLTGTLAVPSGKFFDVDVSTPGVVIGAAG